MVGSPCNTAVRNVLVLSLLVGIGSLAGRAAGETKDHWAFQPLQNSTVPANPTGNAVDAFVLAKLEARGLRLSVPADKLALVRRVTFDLTGLPPTPQEVDAFLADATTDAYEKLLDRLLASPAFGERWGRHWLDAAGYVDVLGGDGDAAIVKVGDGKWRYRDWVVKAFNDDKPYDRFLLEQIAGDELVDWRTATTFTPETVEWLTATGFLRVAADDSDETELNTPVVRHGVLQRTIETVANNVLALTVNCAKCHDHKYDPISQRDYYRLAAVFSPAFSPDTWLQPAQRRIADVSATQEAEINGHNAEVDRQVAELRAKQAALRQTHEQELFDAKLAAAVPEASRAAVKAAILNAADKRDDAQKQLVATHEAALKVTPEEVTAALSEIDRHTIASLEQQAGALTSTKRPAPGSLQAVYDAGPPTPMHLLKRGDHTTPGQEVSPGILTVLSPSPDAATLADAPPYAGTSGRRLALARRLTDTKTPAGALVARVRVNRIWHHLFGRGIVATDDNFGTQGTPPTHPELLDWLATRFASGDWRLKPFLRLLMTSATYRQTSASPVEPASAADPVKTGSVASGNPASIDPASIDPANDLLWRMRLRRLESEAVRDTILAVSAKLDRTPGGPPILTAAQPDGSITLKEDSLPTPTAKWRRSLYLLARRNYHPSVLGVFDQPVLATNCTARQSSAVVTQSLTMLNDAFVLEQADAFAERVLAESGGGGSDPGNAIDLAFRLALTRPPTPEEQQWSAELLHRQQDRARAGGAGAEDARRQSFAQLCHVLLNSSEFLYVP